MKKTAIALITLFLLFGFTVLSTSAAPLADNQVQASPFTGTFAGPIYGDNNSSATMTLKLEQTGNKVTGTAYLTDGLYIKAGNCGNAYVPASVQAAEGAVSAKNPDLLYAEANLNVSGINVTIDLVGELNDGELETLAKIDLPWLCGTDPILSGTLEKIS